MNKKVETYREKSGDQFMQAQSKVIQHINEITKLQEKLNEEEMSLKKLVQQYGIEILNV